MVTCLEKVVCKSLFWSNCCILFERFLVGKAQCVRQYYIHKKAQKTLGMSKIVILIRYSYDVLFIHKHNKTVRAGIACDVRSIYMKCLAASVFLRNIKGIG